MPDYMQEQLMVILTTTLSLLTAWSWNSVLQQYVDQYYGRSLSTRVLAAIIVTIVTFMLINWLLNHFKLHEHRVSRVHKADLKNYVIDANYPEDETPHSTQVTAISPMV